MNKWGSLPALSVAVFLSACASTGVLLSEDQISSLQKGKTTYSEAVDRLGRPTNMTRTSDGRRIVSYIYSEAQSRPESFIPIIGAFVGGVDARSSVVTLQFGADNVLEDFTVSQSEMGTGLGAASGTTFDRVDDQPRQAE